MALLPVLAGLLLQPSPQAVFDAEFRGYEPCLVVQRIGSARAVVFGGPRASQRFSPCSTFKVPHTVAALHYHVVTTDEVFPWDGEPRRVKAWEADFQLAGALKSSVVAVYQEIARRLGAERERTLLRDLAYGNEDASGGLDQFWLTSSLRVSAMEQVRIVRGLVRETWPYSRDAMRWTKDNLLVDSGPGFKSFGKTGSGILRDGWQIGWWVGWVESGGETWVFAGNDEGPDAMGHRMRPKVEAVLKSMGVLP